MCSSRGKQVDNAGMVESVPPDKEDRTEVVATESIGVREGGNTLKIFRHLDSFNKGVF